MFLERNVPSSVSLMRYSIYSMYSCQPRICFRCALPGLLAAVCLISTADRVNIFQKVDFPPLKSPETSVRVLNDGGDLPPFLLDDEAVCQHIPGAGEENVVCPMVSGVVGTTVRLDEDVLERLCVQLHVPVEEHHVPIAMVVEEASLGNFHDGNGMCIWLACFACGAWWGGNSSLFSGGASG